MRVLVAGAGGLIGSTVVRGLVADGHEVHRLVRHEPGHDEVRWDPDAGIIDRQGLEGFDAVIDVASMPWPLRWSKDAKRRLYDNRVRSYRLLSESLAASTHKPRVLICASGMGIYPSSGDDVLTESSAIGTDFLAGLQRDGEAATATAAAAGIRVVHLRIPSVLGGPQLDAMARNLRPIGSGDQWMSWVALDEFPTMIEHILVTAGLGGPVNADAPNPVRAGDFTSILARVLGQRPRRRIPALLLRITIGEMADALMLASRRMEPRRLLATGYEFRFPDLEGALRHQLEARDRTPKQVA